MGRFMLHCGVYVFLKKGEQILLMRRANTGYMDGMFGVPSGHLEQDETLVEAARRELLEETGIDVPAEALVQVHAGYRRCSDRTYADYYFVCDDWRGEPKIMETDKCDKAIWADKTEMPEETATEVKHVWACVLAGQPFSDIKI